VEDGGIHREDDRICREDDRICRENEWIYAEMRRRAVLARPLDRARARA
jgi:hypothetical protein